MFDSDLAGSWSLLGILLILCFTFSLNYLVPVNCINQLSPNIVIIDMIVYDELKGSKLNYTGIDSNDVIDGR